MVVLSPVGYELSKERVDAVFPSAKCNTLVANLGKNFIQRAAPQFCT